MLQAFAKHGGTAGGSTHQETLATRVCKGPHHVANTLEAEHGVVHVERNRGYAIVCVGGPRCGKAGHGASLGNALFQNLAVFLLAVTQQHVAVVRDVFLAFAGVDAHLLNCRFQAKGAAFVGHDGHEQLSDSRIFHQGT